MTPAEVTTGPLKIEQRISRIAGNLRPETALPGREEGARPLALRMAHLATPGLSLAILDEAEIAWAGGFGRRMSAAADEVTARTPFQAGSISKPVFALAVMKLVEAGKLDLDANVNEALTSWQVPDNEGWAPRLSLRQLQSHTAGTTVHGFPGYPAAGPRPTLLEVLDGLPPANTRPVIVDLLPGTQFRYSGGGTTIAQQIVVDVLKMPFAEVMRELILEPLGMHDSSFAQPLPAEMAARAACAHPWNGAQTPGGCHVYPEMAAAGLWTTAADLARLGIELIRSLRGEASRLGLKAETVAGMLRPQLPDEKIGQNFSGLGWFCAGEGQDFQFGHQGWNEGFIAQMKLFPARGQGAVVMINSNQGQALPGELLKAIGREYGWPAPILAPVAAPMLEGRDHAGLYRGEDGMTAEVRQDPQGLRLLFGGQPPLPLIPAADGGFFAPALNLRARFAEQDQAGQGRLTLTVGSKAIVLNRL